MALASRSSEYILGLGFQVLGLGLGELVLAMVSEVVLGLGLECVTFTKL